MWGVSNEWPSVVCADRRSDRVTWARHRAAVEAGFVPSTTAPVVAQASRRLPATVRLYDVAARTWTQIANPGVLGWEPMRPW